MKTAINFFLTLLTFTFFIDTVQAAIHPSKSYGSDNGQVFTLPKTRTAILSVDRIKRISIKHGRRIEKIQIEWVDKNGRTHRQSTGENGGTWSHIDLGEDEYIIAVNGQSGSLVDQLTFVTNKRRVFGPYGGSGGNKFTIRLPRAAKVIGFRGRSDQAIDRFGVIYDTADTPPRTETKTLFSKKYGSDSGQAFMLPKTRNEVLSVGKIKKISIKHGRRIEQIKMTWVDRRGETNTESVGGNGGNWSHIYLSEGEYIIAVNGRSGTLIDQLTFITNKRRVLGPYGGNGGNEFNIDLPRGGKVIGFSGRSGQAIEQFGVIYKAEVPVKDKKKTKGNR